MNLERRSVVFAAACCAAASAALAMRPTRRASEWLPAIDLDKQVPTKFGRWTIDRSIVPLLPDPSVQVKLDKIYTQVLARTFVDGAGRRVMLSIAYGADQGSDATAVHRPEFCYSAQGFVVRAVGESRVRLQTHEIDVRRLIGSLGNRFEPITYWITLNDQAALPGVERKLRQIALGLQGDIPDGMLVRVSTIGLDAVAAFALHDSFVNELEQHMPEALRPRYFGRA
jgi:EpsI family protein